MTTLDSLTWDVVSRSHIESATRHEPACDLFTLNTVTTLSIACFLQTLHILSSRRWTVGLASKYRVGPPLFGIAAFDNTETL